MVETDLEGKLEPGLAACLLGWLFLGAAAMATLLMLLPNNDYYRWQQADGTILFRARYVYERIHDDARPIDVAMIGSSRIEASVRVDDVAAGLSRNFGRSVGVVNFGLPEEGRDLQWAVAKELLNNRPDIKLIVLILGSEQINSHPGFRFIGDDASIAGAPIFYNPSFAKNILTLPYRHLSLFIQGLWPWIFQLSPTFDGAIYKSLNFDPTSSFRMPYGTLVDRNKVLTPEQAAVSPRTVYPDSFADAKLRYLPLDQRYAIERHYTRLIADLAKKKNVRVAFLCVPPYRVQHEVFDDRNFYAALGPVMESAGLSEDPANYMDTGHLNRTGTAKLAPRLVEMITPILRDAGERP
jgi:hypothetical protein